MTHILPDYQSKSAKKQLAKTPNNRLRRLKLIGNTTGKVAIFATCYGNHNEPGLVEDLVKIFEHNNIATKLIYPR